MAKPLSILYVSSELIPFAKVGGISDVSYSLPLAVRDVGHDIRVMLPKYGNISERKNKIHEINRLKDIPIKIGDLTEQATVKSSSINNPRVKVQAYITTNGTFFDDNKFIYKDPKTGKDYVNNDDRFIFFNHVVIETCMQLGWYPDIIHCNDWQTALIPALIRVMYPHKFKKTKLIFTIHNIANQGIFPETTFAKTNLPKEIKNNFIHKKEFNFLKGVMNYVEHITTVSPSYASEILQDKVYTNDLNKFLIEKSDKFTGILNGIDNWGWNPRLDVEIAKKYTSNFEDYKTANKIALLKRFGLTYSENTPVIGMVCALDINSGMQLLIDSLDKLLSENIQLVLLGVGDPEMKTTLKKIMKKYPSKFSVIFDYDDPLAHQIEAGSDIFLLPSIHEPCGLNAMYSLAYGTLPVVRATGGLMDTIENYNENTKEGNGIVFIKPDPESLLASVKTALNLYQKKDEWQALALKSMAKDYSWEKSVKRYDEIYRNVMKD